MRSVFPLADLLDGWFFRVTETSAGAYLAEGSDVWGRLVSRRGSDPDAILAECVRDAAAIAESLRAEEDRPVRKRLCGKHRR